MISCLWREKKNQEAKTQQNLINLQLFSGLLHAELLIDLQCSPHRAPDVFTGVPQHWPAVHYSLLAFNSSDNTNIWFILMSILNDSVPHPDQLNQWATKILPPVWGGTLAISSDSRRPWVCWSGFLAQRPGKPNAIFADALSSALLIKCGRAVKRQWPFPLSSTPGILPTLLNDTGSLVVTQWGRQIPTQDQGWTLATKLVSLVTHSRLKTWLLLTFY